MYAYEVLNLSGIFLFLLLLCGVFNFLSYFYFAELVRITDEFVKIKVDCLYLLKMTISLTPS